MFVGLTCNKKNISITENIFKDIYDYIFIRKKNIFFNFIPNEQFFNKFDCFKSEKRTKIQTIQLFQDDCEVVNNKERTIKIFRKIFHDQRKESIEVEFQRKWYFQSLYVDFIFSPKKISVATLILDFDNIGLGLEILQNSILSFLESIPKYQDNFECHRKNIVSISENPDLIFDKGIEDQYILRGFRIQKNVKWRKVDWNSMKKANYREKGSAYLSLYYVKSGSIFANIHIPIDITFEELSEYCGYKNFFSDFDGRDKISTKKYKRLCDCLEEDFDEYSMTYQWNLCVD